MKCVICLDTMHFFPTKNTLKPYAVLSCGHKFHLDCMIINCTYMRKIRCPMCRRIQRGNWLPFLKRCLDYHPMLEFDQDLYDLPDTTADLEQQNGESTENNPEGNDNNTVPLSLHHLGFLAQLVEREIGKTECEVQVINEKLRLVNESNFVGIVQKLSRKIGIIQERKGKLEEVLSWVRSPIYSADQIAWLMSFISILLNETENQLGLLYEGAFIPSMERELNSRIGHLHALYNELEVNYG